MPYKARKLNPLGIRKLDVQALRRAARKDNRAEAERTVGFWFDPPFGDPMPLNRQNVTRMAEVMLERGWERGVKDGAKATRDRVAEALERGTLIKPED
jgi:hypothetical protein